MDDKFLKKLKELTASFNSLTESKIRLDKAEKAIEEDMSPEEEQEAVIRYLADLPGSDAQRVYTLSCRLRSGKADEAEIEATVLREPS